MGKKLAVLVHPFIQMAGVVWACTVPKHQTYQENPKLPCNPNLILHTHTHLQAGYMASNKYYTDRTLG